MVPIRNFTAQFVSAIRNDQYLCVSKAYPDKDYFKAIGNIAIPEYERASIGMISTFTSGSLDCFTTQELQDLKGALEGLRGRIEAKRCGFPLGYLYDLISILWNFYMGFGCFSSLELVDIAHEKIVSKIDSYKCTVEKGPGFDAELKEEDLMQIAHMRTGVISLPAGVVDNRWIKEPAGGHTGIEHTSYPGCEFVTIAPKDVEAFKKLHSEIHANQRAFPSITIGSYAFVHFEVNRSRGGLYAQKKPTFTPQALDYAEREEEFKNILKEIVQFFIKVQPHNIYPNTFGFFVDPENKLKCWIDLCNFSDPSRNRLVGNRCLFREFPKDREPYRTSLIDFFAGYAGEVNNAILENATLNEQEKVNLERAYQYALEFRKHSEEVIKHHSDHGIDNTNPLIPLDQVLARLEDEQDRKQATEIISCINEHYKSANYGTWALAQKRLWRLRSSKEAYKEYPSIKNNYEFFKNRLIPLLKDGGIALKVIDGQTAINWGMCARLSTDIQPGDQVLQF